MRALALVTVFLSACATASSGAPSASPSASVRAGCASVVAQRADSDIAIGAGPQRIALPAGAGPVDIQAAEDGTLWFSDNRGSRIGRLSPAGRLTLWTIPGAAPSFLAIEGADVWVPDQANGAVLRVSGDTVTRCLLPSASSTPFSAVIGRDGAVWIAEKDANAIARMTRDGGVTEYRVPATPGGPVALAVGPEGDIWFTEDRGAAIGRVGSNGEIRLYPLPDRARGLARIVAGPDGAMWFAEYSNGRIGRITAGGDIMIFPLDDAGGQPNGLAVAKGALYLTQSRINVLSRIDAEGRATTVATTGAFPDGLAAAGGRLWITEYNAGDLFVVPI